MVAIAYFMFLVYWIKLLCYLFPAVSYLVTNDWKKVFFDCFGPEILVADAITTLVTLWYHIFGPKKSDSLASIILHVFGLCLDMMSICMFAMYQSLCGGVKKAIHWFYGLLCAFAVVALFTFMWIHMGVTIDKENDHRAILGYKIAVLAEAFQVVWPAFVRVKNKNYVSDERPILNMKISATTLSVATSSYEFWYMFKEDFWSSPVESRFMVLSLASIVGGSLQLIVRYIGPERFSTPIERLIGSCEQWMVQKRQQFKRCWYGM